ncbi:MAG: peptide-N-glycosidase F-related protein [Ferruginibacter sp.]
MEPLHSGHSLKYGPPNGWLLSVDFDFLEGTPDYQYSSITKVLQYNENSLAGVIYGEDASSFDLTKTITIPTNAEAISFRTIITGWGEATPYDPGGRPCAEWCFRTHKIRINGADAFSHDLDEIGCATNPVNPQNGNDSDERAGWCPGMAVPVRENQLSSSMAGQSFTFEYYFTPWVNDLSSPNPNPHAYYAISNYVVVKSNTPIGKATVTN